MVQAMPYAAVRQDAEGLPAFFEEFLPEAFQI